MVFVDGPPRPSNTLEPVSEQEWVQSHESFDWGQAALDALDGWDTGDGYWKYPFDWTRRLTQTGSDDSEEEDALAMT